MVLWEWGWAEPTQFESSGILSGLSLTWIPSIEANIPSFSGRAQWAHGMRMEQGWVSPWWPCLGWGDQEATWEGTGTGPQPGVAKGCGDKAEHPAAWAAWAEGAKLQKKQKFYILRRKIASSMTRMG